jgi:hypothetical protein
MRGDARRRRAGRCARVDVGLGAAIALLALLFGPGLGILTLLAPPALVACAASAVLGRRRRSAVAARSPARASRDADPRWRRGSPAPEDRRSPPANSAGRDELRRAGSRR